MLASPQTLSPFLGWGLGTRLSLVGHPLPIPPLVKRLARKTKLAVLYCACDTHVHLVSYSYVISILVLHSCGCSRCANSMHQSVHAQILYYSSTSCCCLL